MVEPDVDAADQPIVQPRLVRFLRERPKLLGGSFRNDFLLQLERNITERRRPDTMAERAVQKLFQEAQDAAAPATRDRMRQRMRKANEGVLEKL